MGTILEAFKALGVTRIAVGSPYPEEVNKAERKYFESQGLSVTADESVILFEAQQRLRHMNLVTEADVEELAKHIDSPDAEAIFLSCGDMATLRIVDKLEKALGKPVVTSVQTTFWGALRAAGIDDRIDGCGTLLATH